MSRIKSLEDLKIHKRRIQKELKSGESVFEKDALGFTNPLGLIMDAFELELVEQNIPLHGLFKLILNGKRVYDIIKLSSAICYDFRRRY